MGLLKDAETKPVNMDAARELTTQELRTELDELLDAQFRLRFRSATEKIDNPLRVRTTRRNIARLKTLLKERADG